MKKRPFLHSLVREVFDYEHEHHFIEHEHELLWKWRKVKKRKRGTILSVKSMAYASGFDLMINIISELRL